MYAPVSTAPTDSTRVNSANSATCSLPPGAPVKGRTSDVGGELDRGGPDAGSVSATGVLAGAWGWGARGGATIGAMGTTMSGEVSVAVGGTAVAVAGGTGVKVSVGVSVGALAGVFRGGAGGAGVRVDTRVAVLGGLGMAVTVLVI